MPRQKRSRLILTPPSIQGMTAFGIQKRSSEKISLYFEEYQAIKLLDYEGMTQEQASTHMNISRPTVTRVYESARRKVAKAMTEGKDLVIRGGKFHFDDSWFRCSSCNANFNVYEHSEKKCPICGSIEMVSLNDYYSATH